MVYGYGNRWYVIVVFAAGIYHLIRANGMVTAEAEGGLFEHAANWVDRFKVIFNDVYKN